MQVDLEAMAGESLANSGCDEAVVVFSVIVVTIVLCDEICVVVLALMSKPEPDSVSNKVNHQRDPVLERGPQNGNHIMILSHENVLAHSMALLTPHAQHSKSRARLFSPYQCQDALKFWVAETECWEVEKDCLHIENKCWTVTLEVQDKCWKIEDKCQRCNVNSSSRKYLTHSYSKPKEITPADIMVRWNLN